MKMFLPIVVIALALPLQACGQKGPLVTPPAPASEDVATDHPSADGSQDNHGADESND